MHLETHLIALKWTIWCGREVGADDSRERVTCLHSPTLSDGELSDDSLTTGSVENRTWVVSFFFHNGKRNLQLLLLMWGLQDLFLPTMFSGQHTSYVATSLTDMHTLRNLRQTLIFSAIWPLALLNQIKVKKLSSCRTSLFVFMLEELPHFLLIVLSTPFWTWMKLFPWHPPQHHHLHLHSHHHHPPPHHAMTTPMSHIKV